MYQKATRVFFLFTIVLAVFYACTFDRELILDDEHLTLNLRWVPGFETQTQDEMLTGLTWALSNLGAELPRGSLQRAIFWQDDNHFSLNLNQVGFKRQALFALSRIIDVLVASGEYEQANGIDVGRFIMLTVNSTYHYYEITDVPQTLEEFRGLYDFRNKSVQVVNSSITSVNRLIEIAEAESYAQIAHISGESDQPFSASGDFSPDEFEVLDMMPNGQIRFGLYDKQGRLKAFADETITIAGKPAKCLWCHEVNIQPLFLENAALGLGNTLTQEAFNQLRGEQMMWLMEYRAGLSTDLDYSRPQEHERMEKIYEDFMEPSAARLSLEWNISLTEVERLLTDMPTYSRNGQPGFYHRKDVDPLAPYSIIRVPESAREFSSYEPDFF